MSFIKLVLPSERTAGINPDLSSVAGDCLKQRVRWSSAFCYFFLGLNPLWKSTLRLRFHVFPISLTSPRLACESTFFLARCERRALSKLTPLFFLLNSTQGFNYSAPVWNRAATKHRQDRGLRPLLCYCYAEDRDNEFMSLKAPYWSGLLMTQVKIRPGLWLLPVVWTRDLTRCYMQLSAFHMNAINKNRKGQLSL